MEQQAKSPILVLSNIKLFTYPNLSLIIHIKWGKVYESSLMSIRTLPIKNTILTLTVYKYVVS